MIKSKKLIVIEEDEDDEIDEEFMEEQKRMLRSQHDKELEEKNQFDNLCDGVLVGFNLLRSAFSDLLELKDILLEQNLPPSLLMSLLLTVSKLFRSITDVDTPLQELIRLVNLFSVPWKTRKENLKKIHSNYESKERQLNIALKRLNKNEKNAAELDKEKSVINWGKAFTKVVLNSSDSGNRKWKFAVRVMKKKLQQGVSLAQLKNDFCNNSEEQITSFEDRKVRTSVTSEGMFNIDREIIYTPDDSELGDLMSTGSTNDHEMFTVQQIKPICEDKNTWTGDLDIHHRVGIRIYSSSQLCNNQRGKINYTIESGSQQVSTSTFPKSFKSSLSLVQDNGNNLELKSKFSQNSSSLAKSSRRRPKKLKFFDDELSKKFMDNPEKKKVEKIDRNNFQDVILDVDDQKKEIKISVSENNKSLGNASLDWKILSSSATFTKNISNNSIEKVDGFENQMKKSEIIDLPIQGGNLLIKSLPIAVYWIKEENSKVVEKSSNTESFEKLIHHLTGIDLQTTSKIEVQRLLEKMEKVNVSTSPIPMNNRENIVIVETQDTYISEEEIIKMRDKHKLELDEVHQDYENKLKEILQQLHQLQQDACIQQETQPAEHPEVRKRVETTDVPDESLLITVESSKRGFKNKRQTVAGLPDWGSNLPQDVWQRMTLLTDELIKKRQKIEARIRTEIALNIEKKLQSQYKLQRTDYNLADQTILPAIFMPTTRIKNVFDSKARLRFHDGSCNPRLTQPPSIFQLPPLHERTKATTVNLYELSKPPKLPSSAPINWLQRLATASSSGRVAYTTPQVARLED